MEKTVTAAAAGKKHLDRMFWILLAAGLLLFAIVTIPPGARRAGAVRRDADRTRLIVAGLEQAHEVLSQRERALQSDPFYEELVLRTKMKYTKPGEKEIQTSLPDRNIAIVDAPKIDSFVTSAASTPGLAARITNWALLAASALMVAGAFVLFDRPTRSARRETSPSPG